MSVNVIANRLEVVAEESMSIQVIGRTEKTLWHSNGELTGLNSKSSAEMEGQQSMMSSLTGPRWPAAGEAG